LQRAQRQSTSHLVFRLFILVNKLIVKGLNSAYSEPLRSLLFNTFYLQPTVNDSYQLQFTAYDDGSVAFNLLTVEASVIWDGQEFIIKQIVPDYSNGLTTIQVTATHVGYDVSRIFQREVKTGTLTYSVNDVLAFFLSGNTHGFTWQVIGNFNKQQITDLGNCSGKDMLSKIIETWPDAIFWPDNRNIRIYQHDTLAQSFGHRIDYLNNTKEVKLTYDSTTIINKLRCVSVEVDGSESSAPIYYFSPFYVTDDESVKQFGEHDGGDVSDDRYHDVNSMKSYGQSQLVPSPSLSIDVTNNENDRPTLEEIVRLEIRPFGYVTDVEVVSYTYYPLDRSQPTQVTLNNRSKTILDYRTASNNALQKSVATNGNYIQQTVRSLKTEIGSKISFRQVGGG